MDYTIGLRKGYIMLNILLVEDSDTDAEMIKRALEKHMKTAAIVHAGTISAAERLLSEQAFNAVILDLGLPDSTGPADTYARIAKAAEKTPVIISTNINDPIFMKAMANRGADAYLNKDMIAFKPDQIRNAITFAMERHDQLRKAFNEKEAAQKEAEDKDAMLNYLMGGYSVTNKPYQP